MLASPIGGDLVRSLEAKQIKAFNFSTAGFRHVLNYKKPVKTPEDLTGLKICTLDNPVHVAIMNAMGVMRRRCNTAKSRPHYVNTPLMALILRRLPP